MRKLDLLSLLIALVLMVVLKHPVFYIIEALNLSAVTLYGPIMTLLLYGIIVKVRTGSDEEKGSKA